jgi:hypothetical protein
MKTPTSRAFDRATNPQQYIVPVAVPARTGCSKKQPKRCAITTAEHRVWWGLYKCGWCVCGTTKTFCYSYSAQRQLNKLHPVCP